MFKKCHVIIFVYSFSTLSVSANSSNEEQQDIFATPLHELIKMKVSTGSLLSNDVDEAPSAVTVIRRDQIELSGARNLANLLEQHVPGMMLMSHSEGDKIGLRGLIAAENYKLLLLLNGRNITNMVYEGAILEIDQWEMGDIEQVEVIRGPGSVTYGTGAIAGIINIITKKENPQSPSFSIGLSRNETFRSDGVNMQFNQRYQELGVYAFASYRDTDGYDNPDYFALSPSEPTDNRFVGKRSIDKTGPQDFLADGHDRPQIKAHIGVNYGENFNSWMRYTQSGQTHAFRPKVNKLTSDGVEEVNGRTTDTRSFVISSDYKHVLTERSHLDVALTFDSQEYNRWVFQNFDYPQDSSENIKDYAFSQERFVGSLLYDYSYSEALNFVVGYEYNHIDVGAPWHKNDDYLLIQEGGHIISDVDTSVYLQDPSLNGRPKADNVYEVGGGMQFETHSQLFEGRYQPWDKSTFFYAHRIDFSSVTDPMYSPRFSIVQNMDKDNTLVAAIQRAQRMMPLRAQYLDYKRNGKSSNHETLDSVEVSYTNNSLNNTSLNMRTFYNDISAVGYTGVQLEFLTDVELYGVELSATYQSKHTEITINHSYLDTISVDMNEDLKTGSNRNNISFADYYLYSKSEVPIFLESYGDGLNNVSQNVTKFLLTSKFLDDKLTAHMNAQVFWDYDGSYDEMKMYEEGYANFDRSSLSADEQSIFDTQKTQFYRERELLEESDSFETDYSVNASLTYLWPYGEGIDLYLKAYVENILHSKDRYKVSTGSNRFYPERLSYMEEPRAYGLVFEMRFK